MRIVSLKATNIELTEAIRSYVEKKSQSLEKLMAGFGPAVALRVEVGKTSNHHNKGPFLTAEFTLDVPGKVFRSEEEREDLYEAVDVAIDDLRRQIKEYKDARRDSAIAPRPGKE